MGETRAIWSAAEVQMTGEARDVGEASRQGTGLVDDTIAQIEQASGGSWSVMATPAMDRGSDTAAVAADSMGSLMRGMAGQLLGLTRTDQGLVATMRRDQRVEAWDVNVIQTQQVMSMGQAPTANLMGMVPKLGQQHGSSRQGQASGSLDVESTQEAKGTLSNAAKSTATGFARNAMRSSDTGSLTSVTTERHESHMGSRESWCASWGPIDGIPQPYTQAQCLAARSLSKGSSSVFVTSESLGVKSSLTTGIGSVAEAASTNANLDQVATKAAMVS